MEHLLAATVDLLQGANWQRAAAGAKTPPQRPKPIRRPGDAQATKSKRTALTPEQIAARLRAQRRS